MDGQVVLNEQQAKLVLDYDGMNSKGKEILLGFSASMVRRFPMPSAQVFQFTLRRRQKIA